MEHETMNDEPALIKKEKEKARIQKRQKHRAKKSLKPKDMPRRPLSAYNIFFKDERFRMINDKQNNPNEKKLGFEMLAKTIGKKWRELPASALKIYKDKADEDTNRYKYEMEIYHQNVARKRNYSLPTPLVIKEDNTSQTRFKSFPDNFDEGTFQKTLLGLRNSSTLRSDLLTSAEFPSQAHLMKSFYSNEAINVNPRAVYSTLRVPKIENNEELQSNFSNISLPENHAYQIHQEVLNHGFQNRRQYETRNLSNYETQLLADLQSRSLRAFPDYANSAYNCFPNSRLANSTFDSHQLETLFPVQNETIPSASKLYDMFFQKTPGGTNEDAS
mmetsp:Transcript_6120/g.9394  ORF Transcript_6120/g.9394 Transcript_6120/m.9394 type:complete len:331 (-) Transcript_6120:62-1054(-)